MAYSLQICDYLSIESLLAPRFTRPKLWKKNKTFQTGFSRHEKMLETLNRLSHAWKNFNVRYHSNQSDDFLLYRILRGKQKKEKQGTQVTIVLKIIKSFFQENSFFKLISIFLRGAMKRCEQKTRSWLENEKKNR